MNIGDLVTDFTLQDQCGNPRSLYALLEQGPVVLFFFPLAMSRGCTVESCHFRDLKAEFESLSAQRVGISKDSVERQRSFSEKHQFDYPLLSDIHGEVARQFGVFRNLPLLAVKRWTFVIGTDHRLVDIIKSEVRMDLHADRALKRLREISTSA